MNRKYIAVIIGVIGGGWVALSGGSFFILILTAAFAFFICRISKGSERSFLLFIFLGGLAFRIVLTLLAASGASLSGHILSYAPRGCPDYSTPYIFPDSGYYTLRSWFTSLYWSGVPMSEYTVKAIVKNLYGLSGFIYILAIFFKMFGYSPIASRFINSFLGASTGILVYFTVKGIFSERPGRLAAILTSFFPSVVLWSITNLKETPRMFATCLLLFFLVRFQKSRRTYYLALALASISFHGFILIGSYGFEFILVSTAVLGLYCLSLYILRLSFRKRVALLFLIFVIAGTFIFLEKEKVDLGLEGIFQKMLSHHRSAILVGRGMNYKLLPDEYYTSAKGLNFIDACKAFYKGWFHLMLEPLPWRVQSNKMIITFPQIALWYSLIPFAILGVAILARYRLRESAALLAYFFITTSALALAGANIGTVFRQRDVNTPIFLMFSSVGLVNTFSCLLKDKKERE